MTASIESNTQAILLLTSPLRASARGGDSAALPLSLGEYNDFARALHERKRSPSDLLGDDALHLIAECRGTLDAARLERLLARGLALAQAIELWSSRSIWVVSRAESSYPRRLRARFKDAAPPLVYGCGDIALCDAGGLAIVGSRDASEEQLEFARDAARTAASFGCNVVSGGARGVDQAAMTAALAHGGSAVGMLADGLARAAVDRQYRDALRAGRLVLVSSCDPSAGFHAGLAMQRNRLIYALADAGLVVHAEFEKGGTWAGAIEQLRKFRFGPIYVRAQGSLGKGLAGLQERGAMPWPGPSSAEELKRALTASPATRRAQAELPFGNGVGGDSVREAPPVELTSPAVNEPAARPAAEELFDEVRRLVRAIAVPKSEAELASALGVCKAQAKAWITRLVDEGLLAKTKRPVRYQRVGSSEGEA
ncbi:MAG: DNA-protecting protein DprA [Planctomycetes bacterium]|nr:DNA-protecting protein DprA [Planctomycetota bacterium]